MIEEPPVLVALIARKIGEKDPDGAAVAAVQAIGTAFLIAGSVGVAGALLSPRLLALMGASPDVVAYGSSYAGVMLGGSVTIFLLFVVNAVFRSSGDAATAMRSLWLANILNILLAPCLIFGLGPFPRLGVGGAAVATTISRATGVVHQLVVLARGRGRVEILVRHLGIDARVLAPLLRIASTGTLQVLIESASWLRARAHPVELRQHGARRVHHRHAHRYLAVTGYAASCLRITRLGFA